MKLQRIQCPHLVHAGDITVSSSYIIGCTGRRAMILDRQYNLLQTIEGLDYAYRAHLSPDEKQLLLISTLNKFWVTDLASGTTRKVTIRAPFNSNLELEGCWSHDGQHIYIPALRSKNIYNTLRRYRASDLTVEAEFLQDQYLIGELHPLKNENAYFMIGWNREAWRSAFILMKEDAFDIIEMEKGLSFSSRGIVLEEKLEILLPTGKDYRRYSLDGKLLEIIPHPFVSGEWDYQHLITKYALSACGKYIFMSTNSGFYVLNAATKQLLASIPEQFGVHNFEQTEPGVIAVAAWGGVKLYRIIEE